MIPHRQAKQLFHQVLLGRQEAIGSCMKALPSPAHCDIDRVDDLFIVDCKVMVPFHQHHLFVRNVFPCHLFLRAISFKQ
jgi:hypothetical protein